MNSSIQGILMMIGATVWFFAGLALGWVYFYPPILFVMGLVQCIRGLVSDSPDVGSCTFDQSYSNYNQGYGNYPQAGGNLMPQGYPQQGFAQQSYPQQPGIGSPGCGLASAQQNNRQPTNPYQDKSCV